MIELINISKTFNRGKRKRNILDNVSMTFKKDEVTFITGKSGIGKSTIMKILAGYVKPDSGLVKLDGEMYDRKGISYFSQKCYLFTNLTVLANLTIYYKYDIEEISLILDNLSISSLIDRKVKTLSGGEKQRVQLALTILTKSEIILLDEPTSNLDMKNSERLLELIRKYLSNVYVIMISHDRKIAKKYANRIFKMEKDKSITEIDNNKSLLTDNDLSSKYNNKKRPAVYSSLKLLQNSIVTSIVFCIFFSFLFVGVFSILSVDNDLYYNNLLYDELDNNSLNVFEIDTELTEKEVEDIESIDGVSHVESVYSSIGLFSSSSHSFSLSNIDDDSYSYDISQYDDDFIYKDRLLYGRLPTTDNEVIISLNAYVFNFNPYPSFIDMYSRGLYDGFPASLKYHLGQKGNDKLLLMVQNFETGEFSVAKEYTVTGVFLYYKSYNETDILFYNIDDVFELANREKYDANNKNVHFTDFSYEPFNNFTDYIDNLDSDKSTNIKENSNYNYFEIIEDSIYGQYQSFTTNLYIIQLFILVVVIFAVLLFIKFIMTFLVVLRINKSSKFSYLISAYAIGIVVVAASLIASITYARLSGNVINDYLVEKFNGAVDLFNFIELLVLDLFVVAVLYIFMIFNSLGNYIFKSSVH